jgi:hypothetical protein
MSGADQARMAKSADAADLKSAGRKRLWEFKSPSGHQDHPVKMRVRVLVALNEVSQNPQLIKGW